MDRPGPRKKIQAGSGPNTHGFNRSSKTELRRPLRPVIEPQDKKPARIPPGLVSLPDVDVPVGGGLIGQAASAGIHRLLDHLRGLASCAGNLARRRITGREDSKAVKSTQAELQWDRTARGRSVHDGKILDR